MTEDCISYRIKSKIFEMLLSRFLSISWLVIFVECTKTTKGPRYVRINFVKQADAIRIRRMTDHVKSILIECRKVKKCENVENNFLKSIEKIITESVI